MVEQRIINISGKSIQVDRNKYGMWELYLDDDDFNELIRLTHSKRGKE